MMGIKCDIFIYISDYFDYFYDMVIKMIKEGYVYVDDIDQEIMCNERWNGIVFKCCDMLVEENLCIFEEMKKGFEEGVCYCFCVKFLVDNFNKVMRDFVIYCCNVDMFYYCIGIKWKMYFMYDFVCFGEFCYFFFDFF